MISVVLFLQKQERKIAKKIKYEEENRKHIIDAIMNGLKNGCIYDGHNKKRIS